MCASPPCLSIRSLITEASQNCTRHRCSQTAYKNLPTASFSFLVYLSLRTTCASVVSHLRDQNRSCPRDCRARNRSIRADPRPSISRFRERVIAGVTIERSSRFVFFPRRSLERGKVIVARRGCDRSDGISRINLSLLDAAELVLLHLRLKRGDRKTNEKKKNEKKRRPARS